MLSPPAWWCGLKFQFLWCHLWPPAVTTCVVVWIEISVMRLPLLFWSVTTCVVVWIEIPVVS